MESRAKLLGAFNTSILRWFYPCASVSIRGENAFTTKTLTTDHTDGTDWKEARIEQTAVSLHSSN